MIELIKHRRFLVQMLFLEPVKTKTKIRRASGPRRARIRTDWSFIRKILQYWPAWRARHPASASVALVPRQRRTGVASHRWSRWAPWPIFCWKDTPFIQKHWWFIDSISYRLFYDCSSFLCTKIRCSIKNPKTNEKYLFCQAVESKR